MVEESIRAIINRPNPVDVIFVDGNLDEGLEELAAGEAVVSFAKKEGFNGITVLHSGDKTEGAYAGHANCALWKNEKPEQFIQAIHNAWQAHLQANPLYKKQIAVVEDTAAAVMAHQHVWQESHD